MNGLRGPLGLFWFIIYRAQRTPNTDIICLWPLCADVIVLWLHNGQQLQMFYFCNFIFFFIYFFGFAHSVV